MHLYSNNALRTHTHGAGFQPLDALKELNLGFCGLASLSNENFYGLNELTCLYLTWNDITEIKSDTWTHTPSLQRLDMEGNKISAIE